jgi:hypothetical protein
LRHFQAVTQLIHYRVSLVSALLRFVGTSVGGAAIRVGLAPIRLDSLNTHIRLTAVRVGCLSPLFGPLCPFLRSPEQCRKPADFRLRRSCGGGCSPDIRGCSPFDRGSPVRAVLPPLLSRQIIFGHDNDSRRSWLVGDDPLPSSSPDKLACRLAADAEATRDCRIGQP